MGAIDTVLQDMISAEREARQRRDEKVPTWARAAKANAARAAAGAAIKAFAKLNGWGRAPDFFDLDKLGRGMPTRNNQSEDNNRDRTILDHPIWFRRDRRFVAAVGQPYPPAYPLTAGDLDKWRSHLAGRGLVLHVPPDPFASIHYPGGTPFRGRHQARRRGKIPAGARWSRSGAMGARGCAGVMGARVDRADVIRSIRRNLWPTEERGIFQSISRTRPISG